MSNCWVIHWVCTECGKQSIQVKFISLEDTFLDTVELAKHTICKTCGTPTLEAEQVRHIKQPVTQATIYSRGREAHQVRIGGIRS